MAQITLSLEEIEDALHTAICSCLGLPENENMAVRFPYMAAPEKKLAKNTCFIYVLPASDDYCRLSNLSHRDDGNDKLTEVIESTNAYALNFVCYGPEAGDWARRIKTGLVRQSVRESLSKQYLSLVPGSFTITRAPELANTEWTERYDVSAQIYQYERVEAENSTNTIETVNIKSISERST